jgi:hypothetical protein
MPHRATADSLSLSYLPQKSALSHLCPTGESLSSRLAALSQSAIPSLVFSTSMQRVRVGCVKSFGKEGVEEDVRLDVLLSASLAGMDAARVREERRQVGFMLLSNSSCHGNSIGLE